MGACVESSYYPNGLRTQLGDRPELQILTGQACLDIRGRSLQNGSRSAPWESMSLVGQPLRIRLHVNHRHCSAELQL